MRRALVSVYYDGKDISGEIREYLNGFSYTDNKHGQADTLSIELEDTKGLWVGPWFPGPGDRIFAAILCQDWDQTGDTQYLDCGVFEIDAIRADGHIAGNPFVLISVDQDGFQDRGLA